MNTEFCTLANTLIYPHAVGLARRGLYAEAERGVQFLVDLDASALNLSLQARVYAQQGKYDEASACWKRVLELNPGDGDATAGLACIEKLRQSTHDPLSVWRLRGLLILTAGLLSLVIVILLTARLTESNDSAWRSDAKRISALEQAINDLRKSLETERSRPYIDAMLLNGSIQYFVSGMKCGGSVVAREPLDSVCVLSGAVPSEFIRAQILSYIKDRTRGWCRLDNRVVVTNRYRVNPGDEGLVIATRLFGDHSRWSDIFALNRDQVRHPDSLETGVLLVLPEE